MPASGRRPVLLVGDETAAPAIEGILRSPDPLMDGRAVIEVPTGGDIRSWAHPAGIEVTWTLRQRSDHPTGCPGEAALQYVASHAAVPDNRSGWGGRRRASSPAPTGRGDVARGGGLQPGGDTGAPPTPTGPTVFAVTADLVQMAAETARERVTGSAAERRAAGATGGRRLTFTASQIRNALRRCAGRVGSPSNACARTVAGTW